MASKKTINLNKRYLVVILMFALVIIFGQNLDSSVNDRIVYIDKSTPDYEVGADVLGKSFDDLIATESGSSYRIFWDFSARMVLDDEALVESNEQVVVDSYLVSRTGEKLHIDTINLKTNQPIYGHETNIVADGRYSGFYFQKKDTMYPGSVVIRNVRLYRINVDIAPKPQKETLIGQNDQDKLLIENAGPTSSFVKFTKKDESIGQIVRLKDGAISGVDLYIKTIGNGGVGNYNLELKEVQLGKNNRYNILPASVANYYFDRQKAQAEFEVERNIFHIPLVANHLKKDAYYYIGVNNRNVKFNNFNTLSLAEIAKANSYDDGSAIYFSGLRKPIARKGDLFFRIYGAEFARYKGISLLSGTIIQDLGNGSGFYSYESSGRPLDFLDIFQTFDNDESRPGAYYDSVMGGISALAENNNSIIYRFETIYPMIRGRIYIEPAGEEFVNPTLYYSFDNQNWTEIRKEINAGWSLTYDQELGTLDGNEQIYFKIGYDEDDLPLKKIKLFGIKKIKFYANLKI